ncbi:hypothetical protein ACFL59_05160 [Planctomycetota bacterium]
MAWMFAGTENDMTVGMHQHYHYSPPPPMPPVPFYPHPALGFARDKFATKTKIDNRKAARTGSKTKILAPPHLPLIGPLTHGTGKENTGIQQLFVGVGIGVHPFGGIGFCTIEGKPAVGMLSSCLGCWCVAPGFDMMLPLVGLDLLMIPTRMPTVIYGPAPLALDLFVLIMSIVSDVLDYLINKIPIPFLKTLAQKAKAALMRGMEAGCTAWESGVRPISECVKKGAKVAGATFVNSMADWAANTITGPLGKIPGIGGDVKKWAKGELMRATNKGMDALTDGEYSKTLKEQAAYEKAGKASPNKVMDTFEKVATTAAVTSCKQADSDYKAAKEANAGKDVGPARPPTSQEKKDAFNKYVKGTFAETAKKEAKAALVKEAKGAVSKGVTGGLKESGVPGPVANIAGKALAEGAFRGKDADGKKVPFTKAVKDTAVKESKKAAVGAAAAPAAKYVAERTGFDEKGLKTLFTATGTKGVDAGISKTKQKYAERKAKKEAEKQKVLDNQKQHDQAKKDAPKQDAPKKDAPKQDAPKKDAPKKDAPKKDAKKEPSAADKQKTREAEYKKNLEDKAKSNREAAQKNKENEAKARQRTEELKKQKDSAKTDAEKQQLDAEIKKSAAAAERMKMTADAQNRQASDFESHSKDKGMLEAHAQSGSDPSIDPWRESMSPDEKNKFDGLVDEELGRK